MKKYKLEESEYELVCDYKGGFDYDAIREKFTDYFLPYDYIIGDWSYGSLRLKGFNDKSNKGFNKINDFSKKDEYLKQNCAYDCKYFIIKKV